MMLIKNFFLILLVCIFSICVIFIFLLGTNIGSNLFFIGITHCIPGLVVESVSGSWGNFNIMRLIYRFPSGIIKMDELYLSINLKCMLFKQINIEHVFLKNACIFIQPQTDLINSDIKNDQKINNHIFFLNLCSVILKDIIVHNLHIILDNIEFQCRYLNTGLIFQNNLLKILPTYFEEGFVLNKFSLNSLQNEFDFKIKRVTYFLKDALNLKCKFETLINNVLKKMFKLRSLIPISCILKDIQGINLYFRNSHNVDYYKINHFQGKILCNSENIYMKFNFKFPYGCIKTVGNIILNNCYPIHLILEYTKDTNIKNDAYFKLGQGLKNINLMITGFLIDELCIRCDILNIVSIMHILCKIKPQSHGIPIDLLIIGKKMSVFLLDEKPCILEKMSFHVTGELYNNCCVHIKSELTYKNLPKIYFSLCIQGNAYNYTISKLKLKISDGYCDIKGNINCKKSIYWDTVCVFHDIKSNKNCFNFFPIDLSGKIVTTGYVSDDAWDLTISEFKCIGKINNNQIECTGSVYVGSDDKLSIPFIFIKWGSSILEISGGIKKKRIFDIDLKFKRINCFNISSQLNGNVDGFCKLYGSIKSPILLLKIHAYSLVWKKQAINIENVLINSNIYFNSVVQSNFSLTSKQIQYKNILLNQLSIIGQGDFENHCFNIKIYGDKLSGVINLLGKFNLEQKIWNGQILKTKIVTSMGTWQLMQDITLMYQYLSNKIILKSHYWSNDYCQFAVSNLVQRNILNNINTVCKKFNIQELERIPIKTVNINNFCIFFTDFYWIIGDSILPQGTIYISGSELSIKYKNHKEVLPIITNNLTVQFTSNQAGLFGGWVVSENSNQNYGNFFITDIYNDPKILGKIYVQDLSLTPILKFLFQSKIAISEILNININFTGYLHSPSIYGVVKCVSDNTNKSDCLVSMKCNLLQIMLFGDYADIYGIIETNSGKRLCLDGRITDCNSIKDINISLNLIGNQVNIYVSPDIHMVISPKIVCTITSNKIDLSGHIDVPSAQIKIQEFSKCMIDLSSEEVILDQNLNPIYDKSKNCFTFIVSNFTISFGNNVHFNGLGLNTKLKGKLEIGYNNTDLTLMGHINMFSGYYDVYGQNLIIKKGQLLFYGLINQVYLDIEVVRNVSTSYIKDEITAGMRIAGMIGDLKLDFFSNSALLSQQEIVSFLLNGYNVKLSDINDINMITSLLVGFSIKRYEKFINKIGHVLGVTDLKLNTQDFNGALSLVTLSGYIIPGLQIKYGIGIFDLLTAVTIRYRVCSNLYLEATSGGYYQGLDVLYQLSS